MIKIIIVIIDIIILIIIIINIMMMVIIIICTIIIINSCSNNSPGQSSHDVLPDTHTVHYLRRWFTVANQQLLCIQSDRVKEYTSLLSIDVSLGFN